MAVRMQPPLAGPSLDRSPRRPSSLSRSSRRADAYTRLPADEFDQFVDDVTTKIRQSLGLPYDRRPPVLAAFDGDRSTDVFGSVKPVAPAAVTEEQTPHSPIYPSLPPRRSSEEPLFRDEERPESVNEEHDELAPSSPDLTPALVHPPADDQDAISIASSSIDPDEQEATDEEASIIDEPPYPDEDSPAQEGSRIESALEISSSDEEDQGSGSDVRLPAYPPSSQRKRRPSDQRYHDSDDEVGLDEVGLYDELAEKLEQRIAEDSTVNEDAPVDDDAPVDEAEADAEEQQVPDDEVETDSEAGAEGEPAEETRETTSRPFAEPLPPSQRTGDALSRIRHTLDREAASDLYGSDDEEDEDGDEGLVVDDQDADRIRAAGKRPSPEDESDARAEADYFDDEEEADTGREAAMDVDDQPDYDADSYLDEPVVEQVSSIYPSLADLPVPPAPENSLAAAPNLSFADFLNESTPSAIPPAIDPTLLAQISQASALPPSSAVPHEHYAQAWQHLADNTERDDGKPRSIEVTEAEPDEVDVEVYERETGPHAPYREPTPPTLIPADAEECIDGPGADLQEVLASPTAHSPSTRSLDIDAMDVDAFPARPTPAEAFATLRSNARFAAAEQARVAFLTSSVVADAPPSPPPSPPRHVRFSAEATADEDGAADERERASATLDTEAEASGTHEVAEDHDIEVRSDVSSRAHVDDHLVAEEIESVAISEAPSLTVEHIEDSVASPPPLADDLRPDPPKSPSPALSQSRPPPLVDYDDDSADEATQAADVMHTDASAPAIEVVGEGGEPLERPDEIETPFVETMGPVSDSEPIAEERASPAVEAEDAPIVVIDEGAVAMSDAEAEEVDADQPHIDEAFSPMSDPPVTEPFLPPTAQGAPTPASPAGEDALALDVHETADDTQITQASVATASSSAHLVAPSHSPVAGGEGHHTVVDHDVGPDDALDVAAQEDGLLVVDDAGSLIDAVDPAEVEVPQVEPDGNAELDVLSDGGAAVDLMLADEVADDVDADDTAATDGDEMGSAGDERHADGQPPHRRPNVIAPGVWDPSEPIVFGGTSLEAAVRQAAYDPERAKGLRAGLGVADDDSTPPPITMADLTGRPMGADSDASTEFDMLSDDDDIDIQSLVPVRLPLNGYPGRSRQPVQTKPRVTSPRATSPAQIDASDADAAVEPQLSNTSRSDLLHALEDPVNAVAAGDAFPSSESQIRQAPPAPVSSEDENFIAFSPPPVAGKLPGDTAPGRVTRSRARASLSEVAHIEPAGSQKRGRRKSDASTQPGIDTDADTGVERDWEMVAKPDSSPPPERGRGKKRTSGGRKAKRASRKQKIDATLDARPPTPAASQDPPTLDPDSDASAPAVQAAASPARSSRRSRQISGESDGSSVAGQLLPMPPRERRASHGQSQDEDDSIVAGHLGAQAVKPRSSPVRPRLHHHASATNAQSYRPPSPVKRPDSSYSPPRTRSQCTYRKLAVPSSRAGSEYVFLVPGCSTAEKDDDMFEEDVRDLGEATEREQGEAVSLSAANEAHAVDLGAMTSLTRIVGLDIIHEGQCELLCTRPTTSFAVVVPATAETKRKRDASEDEGDETSRQAKRSKSGKWFAPLKWFGKK